MNYPRFMQEFESCVDNSFQKVYAIARGSKVTGYQFEKLCERVGTPARRAPASISHLINGALIEEAFVTEESAFNAVLLRRTLKEKLARAGAEVMYGREVERFSEGASRNVKVALPFSTARIRR